MHSYINSGSFCYIACVYDKLALMCFSIFHNGEKASLKQSLDISLLSLKHASRHGPRYGTADNFHMCINGNS